jgi:hypothetical protein
MRLALRQSRSRHASRVQIPGRAVDERLVVGRMFAVGGRLGLQVGLLAKLGGADIRNPDLNWSQALLTQSLAVSLDPTS